MHVWVEGRVQGVFFRDSTRRKALELGLDGWVKNLPDGRVEAVFVGSEQDCERALSFVQNGPPQAYVTRVRHEWAEGRGAEIKAFEIRY